MQILNLFIIFFCCIQITIAQEQEVFNEQFKNTAIQEIVITNLFGGITVVGTSNDQIEIQVLLEKGTVPKDMSIDYKLENNFLAVYLKTPCSDDKSVIRFNPENPLNINHWKNNCDWNNQERYMPPTFQFLVKIPADKNIYVSTVNDGKINISNVHGKIVANNVNGEVKLDQVTQVLEAKTINGDVIVKYNTPPILDANFATINGNIKINLPETIDANTSFKTMRGDFYTDLKQVQVLTSSSVSKSNKQGFKYKIDSRRRMQIGNGGVKLDFETMNGDAYLTLNH